MAHFSRLAALLAQYIVQMNYVTYGRDEARSMPSERIAPAAFNRAPAPRPA